MNLCDISKIEVERCTYGGINLSDSSPLKTKLRIGHYCSIAPGVIFLLGGEHSLYNISTYPFRTCI